MGLHQRTYAADAAPDWSRLGSSLESSLGVRVHVSPAHGAVTSFRATRVGGAAHVWFEDGRVVWEASLGTNPHFLAHLHRTLVAAGFRPLEADTGEAPPRWDELPLSVRLAQGLVGQAARTILMLVLSPLMLVGLVLANVVVFVRKRLRRRSQ